MISKWLKDCLVTYDNLNHFCHNENLLNNIVLENFSVFQDIPINIYISYQDGLSGTVSGVFHRLSLVVEFPYSERQKVKSWFSDKPQNFYFIGEVNNTTSFLEYDLAKIDNMTQIEFIKYTGEYPSKCMGDIYLSINDIEYVLSLNDITNGTPYDLYNISKDSLPKEIQKHYKEIKNIIITNIPNICCGGCINEKM